MIMLLASPFTAAAIQLAAPFGPERSRARRVSASTLHQALARQEMRPTVLESFAGSIDMPPTRPGVPRVLAERGPRGRSSGVHPTSRLPGIAAAAERQPVATPLRIHFSRDFVLPALARARVAAFVPDKWEYAPRV